MDSTTITTIETIAKQMNLIIGSIVIIIGAISVLWHNLNKLGKQLKGESDERT